MAENGEVLTAEELAVVQEITDKIKESCKTNMYAHICSRIQTEAGLAYVVNRCIKLMSKDNIKLSMALVTIEYEMEGMD